MMRLMLVSLIAGLLLGGAGLYLLAFTDVTSTIMGISLVVTLITLGVFLIVPAKIYIIVRFTRSYRRSRTGKLS
jgi:hypothetical protein